MHRFFLQMHDLEVVSNVYFTHRLHGWMDGWWNFALMKTLEVTQQIKEDNQKKPRASLAAPWPGWRTLLALANSII